MRFKILTLSSLVILALVGTALLVNAQDPVPELGPNADLRGWRPFPDNNPWNTPIANAPLDPNSATLIASIGPTVSLHPDFGANWNGGPFGIPYIVVDRSAPRQKIRFQYADESDPGPYPLPANLPLEGGWTAPFDSDRHAIVLDRDEGILYEIYQLIRDPQGWRAGSGAIFKTTSNEQRPAGWTSADAAGLPIFPGLVRYDEVQRGVIRHALRFTVRRSRRAYVPPARHYASSNRDPSLPPMGMRVRLKANYPVQHYPASARVVLQALKTYGMILADNGSNWFVSGAPDTRWNDDELNTLKRVKGADFEVVRMGPITTG